LNLTCAENLRLLAYANQRRKIQVICRIRRYSVTAVLVFKVAIVGLGLFSTVLAYTLILGF